MILGTTSLMVHSPGSDPAWLLITAAVSLLDPEKACVVVGRLDPRRVKAFTQCARPAGQVGQRIHLSSKGNQKTRLLATSATCRSEVSKLWSLPAHSTRPARDHCVCPLEPHPLPHRWVILKQIPDIKFQEETFLLVSPWWMNLFHLSGTWGWASATEANYVYCLNT